MADRLPKTKELRALPAADIAAQLEKLRQDLWQQRLKAKEGALQQTHQLRLMKRQIARIQMVLKEPR